MLRLLLLIFVCSLLSTEAQIPEFMKIDYEFREYRPEYSHKHQNEFHKYKYLLDYKEESYINKRPYDAIRYDLFVDWSEVLKQGVTDRTFKGTNKITILIEEATDSIEFDIKYLQIDSIFNGSEKLSENDFYFSDDNLIITDKEYIPGDTVEFTIDYTYNHNQNRGFYLYKEQNVPIAYSQNEPEDARYWFPSNDRPYDKAISSIAIKVPEGFTATSNGFLDSLGEDVNGSQTFFYSHPHPITTYLMVANASIYDTYRDWYHRVSNPNDSIPIDYFIWEEDYKETAEFVQNERNARFAFRNVPRMIEIMADIFGEYPFEKYGMTAVEPYMFGGMEHQTMSTVHRNWLYGYAGIGILHEIAHQWLGDLVTCATWNDIWINEGGATFSEHIFQEKWMDDYAYYINSTYDRINRVLNDDIVKEYSMHGIPVNMIFNDGYTLSYYKAGIVYHMLRYRLGDEVFLPVLKALIEEFSYQSIETKDFADFFIKNIPDSPINLEKYFEQWVFGVGYPIYQISGEYQLVDDGTFDITVKIEQTQSENGFYEVYEMPLDIIIKKTPFTSDTVTVYNDSAIQYYEFNYDKVPVDIAVDQFAVLSTSDFIDLQDVTSVSQDGKKLTYIYPNPVKNHDKFYVQSDKIIKSVKLTDQLGNLIQSSDNNEVYIGEKISSGFYFVIVETQSGIETHKLMIMK